MSHKQRHSTKRQSGEMPAAGVPAGTGESPRQRLEIVLKCGVDGSREAVEKALAAAAWPGPVPAIIDAGVGEVNKGDVLLAASASRLIVGFEAGVTQHLEEDLRQNGVEVRLYRVIYRLVEDLRQLTESLVEPPTAEEIIGQARVIALFKSSRHGVILGCEVMSGRLALGERFRVIGAMGPVHEGRIASLHIGSAAVKVAQPPQQVGLKIPEFHHAAVGDLVESFRPPSPPEVRAWRPRPGIFRQWQETSG